MKEHQQALNRILLKEPAIDNMMSFTGSGFGEAAGLHGDEKCRLPPGRSRSR